MIVVLLIVFVMVVVPLSGESVGYFLLLLFLLVLSALR